MKKVLVVFSLIIMLAIAGMPLQAKAQIKKSTLTEVVNGNEFYIHFVKSGQQWTDLTTAYRISLEDIKKYNKHIAGELQSNMIVKVPVTYSPVPTTEVNEVSVDKKMILPEPVSDPSFSSSEFHVVKPKETLYFISKLYGTKTAQLLEWNPGLSIDIKEGQQIRICEQQDKIEPEQTNIPAEETAFKSNHTVVKGETLYSLSKQYEISIERIRALNPQIEEGLKLGQQLYFPEKIIPEFIALETQANIKDTIHVFIYHRVQKKETMYSLSKAYDVSMGDIFVNNPFVKSEGLEVGMRIRIPVILDVEKQSFQVVTNGKVRDSAIYIYGYVVENRRRYVDEIADRFRVSEDEILNLNSWIRGKIKRRQVVKIPFLVIPDVVEDTVQLVDEELIETEEIYTGPCGNTNPQKVFHVALMVPLFADQIHQLDTNMLAMEGANFRGFNFIQFYEGALIAADSLQKLGMNLKLHIFDVDNDVAKTTALLGPDLQIMDLIIGPIYNRSFSIISNYAAQYNIKVVNPLSKRESVVESHSNVFKVQIPLAANLELMARYIAVNKIHDSTNIIILRHNKYQNQDRSAFLMNRIQELTEQSVFIDTSVYLVDEFDGFLNKTYPWSENLIINVSDDQVFVVDVMRQIHEYSDSIPYVLFGMPSWKDINFESQYLLDLKVHIFENEFIDYESESVKYFLWKFRKEYGTEALASHYAFSGYDVTLFFLNALYRFGTDFENCLPHNNIETLEMQFDFRRLESGSFENNHAIGYKYQNYRKVRIR
ncbi:MAG: LysM peptidoglycan-binding domain-containing protein [Bacteroidales bacterium]|nr:LysM peptidoglycan-binding domain-containing protein [Bacteroidales bacterium]